MTIEKLLPEVKRNILLKNHTTFRIGGRAKYFFIAKTKEDLIKAILVAKKIKLPFFILGGGSNLLVSDKGFKGLVIKIQMSKSKCQNTEIYAEAGVLLSQLVNTAIKNNLTGLEWAAGIPGTVGGAIRGNAGAFGFSMADIVDSVEVLETPDFKNQKSKNKNQNYKLKIKNFTNKKCQFKYRDSIFKNLQNLIIISAVLKLRKGKKKEILNKIKKYFTHRLKTQPLNFPSAGSVFKNFILSNKNLSALSKELEKFKKIGKIPAAYLIEKCNLKGKRIDKVKISEKHANFIVNLGNGKARDVKKLIKLAKQKVKNKFGVNLREEICYLGF